MIWEPMISEFSIFSALLFFSLYTLVCCLLCKKVGWRSLRAFGIGVALLVLRCLLPLEFPGVKLIHFGGWYADLHKWLNPYVGDGTTPLDVLLAIWIAGSLISLLRLFYRLHRQYKTIQKNTVCEDHRLSRIYRDTLQEMACTHVGSICISDEYPTPMMAGFRKPHILFPKEMEYLPEEELKFIFRHEITHYQNRDLWIKLLIELLCCALWWNPVVYLLRICISQLLEMRCDSLVCEALDPHQQTEYADTLLKAIKKAVHRPVYITAEYLGYPSKERLEQRFTQILYASSQPKKKGLSVLIVSIAVCAFIGSYMITFVPYSLPEGSGDIYELDSFSFENSFILHYPDGALEVYIEHQLYAKIDEEQLQKEPYSRLPVIEVNISSEEE